MKLHGTVEDNLKAAVKSARRLHATPVHGDTLRYWGELLDHARHECITPENRRVIGRLIIDLESELALRDA